MESRRKQLAGRTAILLIGKLCTQFVSFFMLPLYTSILAPEEYGIVDLINTYITLLLPIVNFQVDLGLFRFMLDCRHNVKHQSVLLTSVMASNLKHCLVYILVFCIAQQWIQMEYKIYLLILVVLNVFLSTLLQFARGREDNIAYTVASFLSAAITILLNVLLVAVIRVGAVGMFWSFIVGQLVAITYLIISQRIWRFVGIKFYDKTVLKEVYQYSLPLVPTNLSWWVISASDRSIITYILNVAANGIYSVASKFSGLVNTFYGIFNMAWTETVSQHIDDDDRDEFLSETVSYLFNLFFCVCVGIIAVMPFAFPFFVNNKYHAAYSIIPILMVAVFMQIICGLFSVVFLAKKNTKENAKTAFIAALMNVVLNILFIRKAGLYAVALSSLVAYSSMAIYRYYTVQRYVRIIIFKYTIVATLIMGIIVITSYYTGNKIFQLISLAITVVYCFIANKNMIFSAKNMIIHKLKGQPL
ncbi:lipopolysaccharide biosynthesis protein [Desulfosporosinus sp. SYSU MS00001]|uniref:lipopolysaccharide biosynthesis protein n=1 Tax=Desulfosporosinus sp. SYSU MS00001 TaxID=3416284 RepID=UPI003CF36838